MKYGITLLLLIAVVCCFASTTGKLAGKVTDQKTGKGLGYVNVTLYLNGKLISGGQTKDNGTYIIINIPPGKYDVKFALIGFSPRTVGGVTIRANQTTTLNQGVIKTAVDMREIQVQGHSDNVVKDQTSSMKPGNGRARAKVDVVINDAMGSKEADEASISNVLSSLSGGVNDVSSSYMMHAPTVSAYPQSKVEVACPPPAGYYYHHYDPWEWVYFRHYCPPYYPETETYATFEENPFKYSMAEPLSTFSIDVDTATYSNVRRMIEEGIRPPRDYVRIEEMLNYFDYSYPQPQDEHPFAVYSEVGACPWNARHQLLQIGIKGKEMNVKQMPASNLVFLLDVSGSMGVANKLSLVKDAMRLLVRKLRDEDRVTIVAYSTTAWVAMPAKSGAEKTTILRSIEALSAGGSTAGSDGLQMAYNEAEKSFLKEGNNRIILCTDGDFNTGASSDAAMEQLVTNERQNGIFLTVLGFGEGNIKDSKMEIMADKGNGNYGYVDNLLEAHKILVKQMAGTLFTIAKDVKLQLEFNPAEVKGYRLIGYENRQMAAKDFNNDAKDAGEIGAGTTVTALYELIPASSDESVEGVDNLKYQQTTEPTELSEVARTSGDLLTIKLRYKQPQGDKSILMSKVVKRSKISSEKGSEDYRFAAAVAGFGMLLRDSEYRGNLSWKAVHDMANGALGEDKEGFRKEFVSLVDEAADIYGSHIGYYGNKE